MIESTVALVPVPVLIETLWNVKVAGVAEDPWPDVRINRNIVECKVSQMR